jgi:arsenate reductase (thioredoxin)
VKKKSVLFVSTYNGARSRMAEAFLNALAGDIFSAESAGLESGSIDPFAVEAMKEENIDISKKPVKNVFDLHLDRKFYNYVIETCDKEILKECPSFPGSGYRIRWIIDRIPGNGTAPEQKLEIARKIRDEIKSRIMEFIKLYKD